MQGIGFRPTALRLANELGIGGEVKNSGGNVSIVASAKKEALDKNTMNVLSANMILTNSQSFTAQMTTKYRLSHPTLQHVRSVKVSLKTKTTADFATPL